jgi:CubicO group peptidase (beta-lactamase class C family)
MTMARSLVKLVSAASLLVFSGFITPDASAADRAASLLPAQLEAAAEYSASRRGTALLVMQGGTVLLEKYSNGSSVGEAHKIYSGTKAFWNLAVLAAAEEGWLDLEERVSEAIPEWRGVPRKDRVTIRQLLDFTSGLDPAQALHAEGFGDRNTAALQVAPVAEPRTSFIYGPASLQVLHEVLKRKLAARGETPTRYLERKVLAPLGLGPQRYLADRAGNPLLATGFMLTAREWSRMGALVLRSGAPVVTPHSFAQISRGSTANRAYALGFWNNRAARSFGAREIDIEKMLEPKWFRQNWRNVCICRDAPSDLLASIGSGYQRLFVVPSLQLIVVRQGVDARFSDGDFLRLLLGRK